MHHDVGALRVKLDLSVAFKSIRVLPEDWTHLSSTWEVEQPDGSIHKEYITDLVFLILFSANEIGTK